MLLQRQFGKNAKTILFESLEIIFPPFSESFHRLRFACVNVSNENTPFQQIIGINELLPLG